MPVQKKIATEALAPNLNSGPSALQLAITFYYANRETPVTRLYSAKDGIPLSALQRAVAAGGEIKTHSEANVGDMILTISEEAALEESCQHMSFWGYPLRLDILQGMAAAVLEDHER
ncbi:hypothetical protein HOY80DRAFT_1054689 [Tuber brumale]|nr:hypothetical protein HOY80DRAFT_1054689 [Tuber brumale]